MNFLADVFDQGYQYRSLNAYRLAVSLVYDKIHVDGQEVKQHPMIMVLLKGVSHQ